MDVVVSFTDVAAAVRKWGIKGFLDWCSSQKIVDACLDAMEEGTLHVCAKNYQRKYLWVFFNMDPRQWMRLCALLQRHGIPSSIVWQDFEFHPPGCLEELEYLWTDLDSMRTFMEHVSCLCHFCNWIQFELRRREWAIGLRRAWLVAVTGKNFLNDDDIAGLQKKETTAYGIFCRNSS